MAANGIPFCGGKTLVFMHPAHEGQGVVLFDQGHVAIAGTNDDILAAKQFYQPDARLLWFRHGNKTYVTRSPATLQQASALVAQARAQDQGPNAQTEAIGKLVAEEGRLVEQKGEIVSQQGKLVGEEGRLVALRPGTPQNQQALDHIRAQRTALQQQIGALNAQTTTLQGRIRQQQADLHARPYPPLQDFNRVAAGLTKLANDALANGVAREVHS